MKFLITLPDNPAYLWQILVQINNFRIMGYEKETHYLVGLKHNQPSDILLSFVRSLDIKAKFHLIDDVNINKTYPASLKPFLVKKFLEDNPEMEKETFFYTDPDVIFLKPLNFDRFIHDDIWYLSDTKSYLDSRYIKSKSEDLFNEMCNIVGISPELVISNDLNAGGAQWIIKNNTYELWDKIHEDSEKLYRHMVDTASKYTPKNDIPIQAWTAEMWSTIWNAWNTGVKTKIDTELDFCMASDSMERRNKVKIYHNAGVMKVDNHHFCKLAYPYSPFKKDIRVSEKSASYIYLEAINDTKKNFANLIY